MTETCKVRALLHFDPRTLPWEEICARFCYTSYDANARARRGIRRLDGVSSIGYVPLDVVQNYQTAPRGDIARHASWRFPDTRVGCPIGAPERCATAGGTVCKLLTLEQPFGWPADAFDGREPAPIELQQLHVSRHLHFLLSSGFREDHPDSARRATLGLLHALPPTHNLLLIVESASAHTDPHHMHIHNVNMVCGSSDAVDGLITIGGCVMQDPFAAVRREVLEETGIDVRGAPSTVVPWSSVVTREGSGPHTRTTSLQEFFFLIDITRTLRAPNALLARRSADGVRAMTRVVGDEDLRRSLFEHALPVYSDDGADEDDVVELTVGFDVSRFRLENLDARRALLARANVAAPW